jgi:hypothetical protein
MPRSSLTLSEVWVSRFRRWLPLVFVVACIGLCFLNWSTLSGPEYGYFYGVLSDPPSNGFAAHGPNHFQSINIWYIVIIICFAVYAVGDMFGPRGGGLVLRLLALSVAGFQYYSMLDYKFYLRDRWNRYDFLENSVYVDIACATALIVLLGIDIFAAIRSAGSITKIPLDPTESATKH